MDVYGFSLILMDVYGLSLILMDVYGLSLILLDAYGLSLILMDVYELFPQQLELWKVLENFQGSKWLSSGRSRWQAVPPAAVPPSCAPPRYTYEGIACPTDICSVHTHLVLVESHVLKLSPSHKDASPPTHPWILHGFIHLIHHLDVCGLSSILMGCMASITDFPHA